MGSNAMLDQGDVEEAEDENARRKTITKKQYSDAAEKEWWPEKSKRAGRKGGNIRRRRELGALVLARLGQSAIEGAQHDTRTITTCRDGNRCRWTVCAL